MTSVSISLRSLVSTAAHSHNGLALHLRGPLLVSLLHFGIGHGRGFRQRASVRATRVDRLADVSRAFHERKGIEAQAQSEKDAAKRADRERRSKQRQQRRMAKAEARSKRRGNDRGAKPSRIEPVLQGDAAAQGSVKC